MALAEPLSSFFNDFAAASCTLGGVAVDAIFDNGYNEAFGMDGTAPVILVKSSDASSTVRGTAVVLDSVSYTVQGIMPDGTGMTRLILEKV